ncbi:MAG: hypothetical protein A3C53_04960 [Omnitrophica WOR_2 bacterium RIFCSPHIGHO2_02_FULL_68_15]|nr:MAG: hypothetical protein A3C53_04960 [Omnitrophica WOR_2 bacterium RIFCSPHIGHO2_02_FULL_68_15]
MPHLIRYQGQAVDINGVPLEGPYTLTFRLYDAETAGTVKWQEAQLNVTLAGGHFSVLLGQVQSLDGVDWGQPLWLSVQVNGEPELAPRQRITSVPLAIVAERLADTESLMPSGAIVLWTGVVCPAGYTRLTAYDGKFLVGSATAGTAGGSNTHAHGAGTYAGPSHTHSIPHNGWTWNGSGTEMSILAVGKGGEAFARPTTPNVSGASGTGPVTGASSPADSRPEFMTITLCKKN